MRPGLSLALACALLGMAVACLRPAYADEWADQAKAADKARKSHDVIQWDQALSSLRQMDHAAAVVLIARFFVEQETYEGEWTNEHGRTFLRVEAVNREGFYASLLARRTNVRSLRALVEGLDDPKRLEGGVFFRALEGNASLHLVEDHIRSRLQRAVRKKHTEVAHRYITLLRGRLHMGDVNWVEKIVSDPGVDADLRLTLFEALPAYIMWDRVLALDPAKLGLDVEALGALVTKHMGTTAPEDDVPSMLARADADANRIEGVLSDENAEAGALDALLESMPAAHVWPAIHAVYQRRWALLLDDDGALEDLPSLHEAFVKIRYARALRRDMYQNKKNQKQKWDRKADDKRILARSPSIDFTQAALAGEIAVLQDLRSRLITSAEAADRIIPAPYHTKLFELNQGNCGAGTISFTHAEQAWQALRDEVLAFNKRIAGPTPAERENAALVNAYRLEYDLLPLRIDLDVVEAARRHSVYCRSVGKIAHTFPGNRERAGNTPSERMINAGYPRRYSGGENVAMGTADPAEVFRMWRGSAPHRRNMLAPWWTEIGVGQSGVFWTQNFGGEPYDQDHDADEDGE